AHWSVVRGPWSVVRVSEAQCTRGGTERVHCERGGYGPRTTDHGQRAMSDKHLRQALQPQLEDLRQRGLYKRERQLQGPQGAAIQVGGREVINFCANNYLGLA